MSKIIVYIDLDDTIFDFLGAVDKHLAINPSQPYPQSKVHFFYNLEPINGAIEGVKWLFNQPSLDCYFLTAPSVMNPLCYTEKRMSLDKHFGFEIGSKIIISPNKGLNVGHYLIDDIKHGKGQEFFSGKILQFGSDEFPDWESIISYFKSISF